MMNDNVKVPMTTSAESPFWVPGVVYKQKYEFLGTVNDLPEDEPSKEDEAE
jgi:hypothetical protein